MRTSTLSQPHGIRLLSARGRTARSAGRAAALLLGADVAGGLPLVRPTATFTRGSWGGEYFLGEATDLP
ncbi:hypothetical protein ACWEOW_22655 [Monashia sp. NPDC004114]